ncbi:serpin-Z10-like [Actinidia eriantha]|uniref:serpin-Z10-like n=1 Tax=Actinidia eriantha TaxID=165200 RepID=UPI00258F5324|nr:serpin-Z10-like [Actinidia eriantha]
MVNGVWVSQQFPLEPSYKEVREDVYDCEAGMVDFATRADEVFDEVNSWTKITTRGLIKNLLGPGSLSSLTTHIVANVLYFKGIWTHSQRFKAKLTENRDFYLLNGNMVSVPFMTSYQDYCSRPFDGFSRACSQGGSLAGL